MDNNIKEKTYYTFICDELLKYAPFYFDGDDFYNLHRIFYIFSKYHNIYLELVDDLNSLTNAMFCHYGIDYGAKQDVYTLCSKILEEFPNGYKSNKDNLSKLLQVIDKNIKKQ